MRNLWRQPTSEALQASVSPANGVVVLTTALTAAFASINLMQVRQAATGGRWGGLHVCLTRARVCGGGGAQVGYLVHGAAGMRELNAAYPHIARWSIYQVRHQQAP